MGWEKENTGLSGAEIKGTLGDSRLCVPRSRRVPYSRRAGLALAPHPAALRDCTVQPNKCLSCGSFMASAPAAVCPPRPQLSPSQFLTTGTLSFQLLRPRTCESFLTSHTCHLPSIRFCWLCLRNSSTLTTSHPSLNPSPPPTVIPATASPCPCFPASPATVVQGQRTARQILLKGKSEYTFPNSAPLDSWCQSTGPRPYLDLRTLASAVPSAWSLSPHSCRALSIIFAQKNPQ